MSEFDTDIDKAQALDHSRPLDVHKWSDFPEVNAAVNAIYTDLKNDPDFTGSEQAAACGGGKRQLSWESATMAL